MECAGTHARVGIGLFAEQLGIFALLTHGLNKFFCDGLGALVVVRYDLRDRHAGFIDFAVNQEGGNIVVAGFLDCRNGRVGAGVITNDRGCLIGNGVVEQFGLLGCIIIVRNNLYLIAKLFCFGGSGLRLCLKERIRVRGSNDVHDF